MLGQFLMKYVASAQEVMCEQCVRPSQENCEEVAVGGTLAEEADALAVKSITGWVLMALYLP